MSVTHTVYSATAQVLPLAAKDLDENKVTPGVLGFIVFAVIGAAVWFLMKSMNKQMGKVDFEEEPEEDAREDASASESASASASADSSGGSSSEQSPPPAAKS